MQSPTFLSMFLEAGFIVKLVMISLVMLSILSWAIIFNKWRILRKLKREMSYFETLFWSGKPLDEVYRTIAGDTRFHHTTAALFLSAMREWRRSQKQGSQDHASLQMRIHKVMDVALNKQSEQFETGLSTLATIGSTSPFIGLFGTVWGIMTSFQAIAISQNTNLAVVAPGIAEALLATALGLVAAIPAVIAYNRLLASFDKVTMQMENFSDEFSAIISRKLDR